MGAKSIDAFNKGTALDENDAALYYNKKISCYKLNQYKRAKECLKKAMELDPQNELYKQGYKYFFPEEII